MVTSRRHAERHHTDRIGWLRAAVLGATDGIISTASLVVGVAAVSFRHLMDAFAQRVGRPSPLHLPSWSKLLARLIIREEHMQQVALTMPRQSPTPRVPGWQPKSLANQL